jgi:regulatory protein
MPNGEKFRRALQKEALRLLVRREHSRLELEQKLGRKLALFPEAAELEANERAAVLAKVLDGLNEKRWQSDQRFAQQRVTHRGARYGDQRLKQELGIRGVDAEVINDALSSGENELLRCRNVWLKKFGGPAENREGFAKQVGFLQYRGFSGATIRQVLKSSSDDSILETILESNPEES